MKFPLTDWGRQQSGGAGSQEGSAAPSADVAFEQQLRETGNSGSRGLIQPPIDQSGASTSEAQRIMQGSGPEATSAPHNGGGSERADKPTGILVGGSKRPVYSQDGFIIVRLGQALIQGGAATSTAKKHVKNLLTLDRWLFENNKGTIFARLADESLAADVTDFVRKGDPNRLREVRRALDHLRTSESSGGIVPITGVVKLTPYPEDVALIKEYKNEERTHTVQNYASVLSRFSDYLREKNKGSIAGRLSNKSLDKDVSDYKKEPDRNRQIESALAHLRKSQAGSQAMELEPPVPPVPSSELAILIDPSALGKAAAHQGASQGAVGWPEVLRAEGHDEDRALGTMDEAGPSSTLEPTAQLAASPPDPQPIMQASGHEYGGAIPGASALQPDQSPWGFVGGIKSPLYYRDASLINGLTPALIKRGFKPRTIVDNVRALARLGRWLLKNKKPEIATRLNDESLDEDTKAFDKTPNRSILKALGHLRASQSESGDTPIASRDDSNPFGGEQQARDPGEAFRSSTWRHEHHQDSHELLHALNLNSVPPGEQALINYEPRTLEFTAAKRRRILSPQRLTMTLQSASPVRAFERHLGEIANSGPPTPPSTDSVGAPPSEPLLTQVSGHEYTSASHGGGDGAMLGAWPLQPGESTGVFTGRSGEPLHSEDAPLVERLMAALVKSGFKESIAKHHVDNLLRLGRWLFKNNKQGIAERLYDRSLDSDAAEFRKKGEQAILTSLGHLRASQRAGGLVPNASRAIPSAADADLIKKYKSAIITERKKEAATAYKYATALSSFSEYLRNNARPGIAGRLDDQSLYEDLWRYEATPRHHPKIGAALAHLRKSMLGAEAVEQHILTVLDPEDEALMDAMRPAEAAAQDTALQRAVSWPEILPAQDQNLSSGIMDEPSPSSYLALQPARVGRSADLLYSEDVPLILGLEEALLRGGAAESTAKKNVDHLLGFGRWLYARDKPGIADRLDDDSLDKDIEGFKPKRGAAKVRKALAQLRTSQAGGVAPVAGHPDLNLHPDDAALIKQYKEQAAATGSLSTARNYASLIANFSHYLRKNDKQSIAARLGDGAVDEDESLNKDIKLYRQSGGHRAIGAALAHLRAGAGKLGPSPLYAEDEPLISRLELALVTANYEKITAQTNVRILRRFSRWLLANEKLPIAFRLYDESLDADAATFDKSGKRCAITALDHLRASQPAVSAPEDPLLLDQVRVADAAAEHDRSAGGVNSATGFSVEDSDQDLHDLLAMMHGAGTSSSLEPIERHPGALGPGEPSGQLNWSHTYPVAAHEVIDVLDWSDLLGDEVLINDGNDTGEPRATKRQRIQNDPEGVFIERRLSQISGSGARALVQASADQPAASLWQAQRRHEHDQAPHALPRHVRDATAQPPGVVSWPLLLPEAYDQDVLWRMVEECPPWSGMASSEHVQTVEKAGRQGPAGSTSTWSLQMASNFDWSMWPNPETAPALSVRAPSPDINGHSGSLVDSLPHELRDDAHFAPVRISSDAQIGAVDRANALHGRSMLVLGAMEWLGDEHITTDYALLQEELQRDNPDLASQTRFVQPAIAHLLRLTENKRDLQQTKLGIVNDKDDKDTANFLFVPVNDGIVSGGGAHWSLLLVDRRLPGGAVAYHYDSARGYNDAPAADLAARLGARLQSARIAQQQNGYDCGVFVLDGTRALIGRLNQGERPQHEALHLVNLIADRQALQDRLRRCMARQTG
ncbi:Ulp1 family isopeptidase [Bradyrhizobium australafricanum]|uniref:Ulp1 family isopeptidase n=1 Tax=Bradyrhizobium australafricanum TaxID=2821406 RepID=UPI001CE2C2B3|nr:Ulp1 family isopeptidase [Bradyrhizobium australafricanum]MCA6103624.1 hypothetical protein [Bradyrhizobium australafricanum]